ncbi:MAG: hypothetical protein COA86_08815 [Kangiella sp.]|nr:MAG: hypothetical protein COA86_08815 [Kangiella sp.]
MKNNLFIRLYFLIVASIIVIGIGINWIWQNDAFQQFIGLDTSAEIKHPNSNFTRNNFNQYELLIESVAFQIENNVWSDNKHQSIQNHIHKLGQQLNLKTDLISADSFPTDSFNESNILILDNLGNFDNLNSKAIYYYLSELNKIIKIDLPEKNNFIKQTDTKQFELLFLILFYGLVAIVIFYWIWPLSKDLNHLQKALKNFDADNWQTKLDFPPASPIAHLADAYNQLLNKIKRLIENEKSMANSISHELRTPLARIRFALQMAKESTDHEFIVQQIQSAEDDVEEMNQLIAEILSYASIDNQAFKAQLSKGDLGSLLELLVARLEKNYPKHIIRFSNSGNTTSVLCDSVLIERAIQNLIVNACKYGEKNIEVSLDENKQGYKISVANDGKMIDKQQVKNIFDAYYQIPSDEKTTGFGLGLSLVKRIADLHKGVILVQQSKLGGAEFVFKWSKNRL